MVGIINRALVGARNIVRNPTTQAAASNAIPIAQTLAVGAGAAFAFSNARDLYSARSTMAGQFQNEETFPSDLIQNDANRNFYMSFKFQAYEKRAINNSPFLRSNGTIRLPIPDNIRDNMSVSYSSPSLGPAVGAGLEAVAGTPSGSGALSLVSEAATATLAGAAAALVANNTGQAGQAAQAYYGIAVNQFQTVLFEKPEFKSHTFSWKFMPRDEAESTAAANIFRTFQYHMLPGVSEGAGLFFSYPSMVVISLYPSSQYLYRFKPCIVKNVSVNYAAASTPSFFKRTGAPTAMTMSIELQEIEYWTNKDFTEETFNQQAAIDSIITAENRRAAAAGTTSVARNTGNPGSL